MIGLYGQMVFQAGIGSIQTFDDFQKTVSARWPVQEIFRGKPLLEYGGPNLIEVSFKMCFITPMTVNPTLAIFQLQEIMDLAIPLPLILGLLPVGRGSSMFVMESLSVNPKYFFANGQIIGAGVEVKLKEYANIDIVKTLLRALGGFGSGGGTGVADASAVGDASGGNAPTVASDSTGFPSGEPVNGSSYPSQENSLGFNPDNPNPATENTLGFNPDNGTPPTVAADVPAQDIPAQTVSAEQLQNTGVEIGDKGLRAANPGL